MSVMYESELVEAEFLLRENRFAARVRLEGNVERVHVPNSGRMEELLVPGACVLLLPRDGRARRTDWDLVMVRTARGLVSIDSRVPNRLVAEAVAGRRIPQLSGLDEVRAEVVRGTSRLDFLVTGEAGEALVEVKGCTLVLPDGLALFPDAPTTRGARHVRELSTAAGDGVRALVLAVVQREDARLFAPNDPQDPAFGDALREAAASGVEVLAYGTRVSPRGIELAGEVPVDLTAVQGVFA